MPRRSVQEASRPARRHAPTVRRALVVLFVGLVVVLHPSGAWAKFTDRDGRALSVGTATLAAPSSVSVTGTCSTRQSAGSAKVTFGSVALADSYTVVLDPPSGGNVVRTTTSGSSGVTFALARNVLGTYTVTITSGLSSWTSAAATRTFTC